MPPAASAASTSAAPTSAASSFDFAAPSASSKASLDAESCACGPCALGQGLNIQSQSERNRTTGFQIAFRQRAA